MKPKKPKKQKTEKFRKISDDMIGRAEKVCRCSRVVGDIIISSTDEKENKKVTLSELKKSIEEQLGKKNAE